MEKVPIEEFAIVKSVRLRRETLFVIFSFLLYFGLLDTFHSYVGYRGEGHPETLDRAIYEGLVFWLPYFLMLPGVLFLVDRYRLTSPAGFVVHAIAALVFTYAHILSNAAVFVYIDPGPSIWPRFFLLLREDSALDYLAYWGMVVTSCILYYYSELRQSEVQASQLEANLTLAQLHTLQAQLNPHFFFNTLQAISILAMTGDQDGVVETFSQLSSLIRLSFDDQRPQELPLARELEFLDIYLAIQQLSFGDRLVVRRQIAPSAMGALVPSMVLQPLVENAIVHGVAKQPGAGVVQIEAALIEEKLMLRVEDNGPGFTSSGEPPGGLGLNATQARLKLLYGADYRLEFGTSRTGGASVTLLIPYVTPPADQEARSQSSKEYPVAITAAQTQ
jgi:hypothetical protein